MLFLLTSYTTLLRIILLDNINQLLLRNTDLLQAKKPLFINLPVDDFFQEYHSIHPKSEMTCYNTNYQFHLQAKQQNIAQMTSVFNAHYQSDVAHDLVIIQFPKSKAELTFTLAMVAGSLSKDCLVLIVGENKSGIKSLEKLTTQQLEDCAKIDSARHCLLFAANMLPAQESFILDSWMKAYSFSINETIIEVVALPGVFSQNGLDIGTQVLLENLPKKVSGDLLDFGCGAGVIASYYGKVFPNANLHLLDVSALALYSAQKTLTLNGLTGRIFPSNSLSDAKEKYDYVISNPPFHQGLKTNYQATETFLSKIKPHLKPRGQVTVVANSFLRYQAIMEEEIGRTHILAKQKGFSIYHCSI
jgi:16S rRNA (guanine1207-N2)-methyltransferase